ncbi:MAG: thiamine pyrophosphate-binding protein [Alphaproteobacteria bacterium]|nr:thiamine pyrophosphate-binding protein [Alphaproteobacteria bacterium]
MNEVVSRMLTGGDLIAGVLAKAGVKHAFALHGGHLEALLKGCIDNQIALHDFRHESSAGHAADAYARATGELGVCIITAGPGFTNAISAIVNAHLDASPVLFLIGAPPLRELETNPLQGGFDQVAMALPAVKWTHRATNTERLAELTAMAIRKATTGRRGPVLMELPIDVLHIAVPQSAATAPTGLAVHPRPAPSPAETEALLALLAGARRPAIIAGGEATQCGAGDALRRFAERSGIPVFANTRGLGLLPSDHPLSGHGAGNLGALVATGGEAPDVVLLLGARLGLFLGGRSGGIVPNTAKVAQIYSDASEIGRLRDIDVPIAADCAIALEALLAASAKTRWSVDAAWVKRATAMQGFAQQMYPATDAENGVHPYHAAAAVMRAAGPEAGYVFDGGEAASWAGDCVRVSGPGRVLSHGYLGCLGIGPGFAIGLQTAFPQRRVIHLTGDGAAGFHLPEFDTMVRHRLPIVTVILNNRVWGMSIHGQQIMYGANYSAITRLGETRYSSVAAGFGCHAEYVTRFEDIAPAMERALKSGKPACVEILTDEAVIHPITLAMLGKTAEGSNDVVVPYYENIKA